MHCIVVVELSGWFAKRANAQPHLLEHIHSGRLHRIRQASLLGDSGQHSQRQQARGQLRGLHRLSVDHNARLPGGAHQVALQLLRHTKGRPHQPRRNKI